MNKIKEGKAIILSYILIHFLEFLIIFLANLVCGDEHNIADNEYEIVLPEYTAEVRDRI